MLYANEDGAVELYHNNVKKLNTNSGGVDISGHCYFPDNNGSHYGTGEDLKIFHDGTDSKINNITGNIYIQNTGANDDSNIYIRARDGENSISCLDDGAVELYHNDVKRFETSSEGYTLKHSSGDVQYYHNRTIAAVAGNYFFDLTSTSGVFIFRTSSSSSLDLEPFSINNTGRLYNNCVSTTTASLTLRKGHSDANGVDYFQCRNSSNGLYFKIEGDGDAANYNNSWGSTSDVKLKENIVDANSQWEDIKAVKVRNFNFKASTGFPANKHIGVIAQELETVSPGLVKESIDRDPDTDEDLGTKTKSVKYSILYMKAIKALQETMAKIETLETKVAALEAK